MQFTENFQANWQEGHCFIMTMPDPMQPEQPRREFKNYYVQWELLEHSPYSLDLAPSDFHLFGLIKKHLGGKCLAGDKEVETNVRKWLIQQLKDFYAVGFDTLLKRWDKCINVGG
jgi:hypothetical protein